MCFEPLRAATIAPSLAQPWAGAGIGATTSLVRRLAVGIVIEDRDRYVNHSCKAAAGPAPGAIPGSRSAGSGGST